MIIVLMTVWIKKKEVIKLFNPFCEKIMWVNSKYSSFFILNLRNNLWYWNIQREARIEWIPHWFVMHELCIILSEKCILFIGWKLKVKIKYETSFNFHKCKSTFLFRSFFAWSTSQITRYFKMSSDINLLQSLLSINRLFVHYCATNHLAVYLIFLESYRFRSIQNRFKNVIISLFG